jgi:hypothetical protein
LFLQKDNATSKKKKAPEDAEEWELSSNLEKFIHQPSSTMAQNAQQEQGTLPT